MTIHSEHPFLPPEDERNPVRRFRGRLPAPVTVWTTSEGKRRNGLTVSSILVADGEPGEVAALIDEDSDFWDLAARTRTVAVSVLSWSQRNLADAFAGTAPAPGGPFKLGTWTDTEWGPVLADTSAWLGCQLIDGEPERAGWGLLVRATIENVHLESDAEEPVAFHRGRYRRLDHR